MLEGKSLRGRGVAPPLLDDKMKQLHKTRRELIHHSNNVVEACNSNIITQDGSARRRGCISEQLNFGIKNLGDKLLKENPRPLLAVLQNGAVVMYRAKKQSNQEMGINVAVLVAVDDGKE